MNVEEVGFRVIRIVTNNHITDVKIFTVISVENVPKPVISHPINPSRDFLLFDPCHTVKKFRNIFLSRNMLNKGQPITADFIKLLHDMQKQSYETCKKFDFQTRIPIQFRKNECFKSTEDLQCQNCFRSQVFEEKCKKTWKTTFPRS